MVGPSDPVVVRVDQAEAYAPRAVGRPRSEDADRAILGAVTELLLEVGFAGLSVEGVAARAGVGKATIYRRWSSKSELVVEAMRAKAFVVCPLVDTGDVRSDLRTMLRSLLASMQGEDGRLMAQFAAERMRHPQLAEEFQRRFVAERKAAIRQLLQRAIERGDLDAGTDVELVAEVGPAMLWHRLGFSPADLADDLPDRIVAQFLPARGAARLC